MGKARQQVNFRPDTISESQVKNKGRTGPGLESGGAILRHRTPFGPYLGNMHEMNIA